MIETRLSHCIVMIVLRQWHPRLPNNGSLGWLRLIESLSRSLSKTLSRGKIAPLCRGCRLLQNLLCLQICLARVLCVILRLESCDRALLRRRGFAQCLYGQFSGEAPILFSSFIRPIVLRGSSRCVLGRGLRSWCPSSYRRGIRLRLRLWLWYWFWL